MLGCRRFHLARKRFRYVGTTLCLENHRDWRYRKDAGILVESTGLPNRGLITVTSAEDASRRDTDSSTPNVIQRIEVTYSGFGEPNIITSPIAAPTLEPTPEPTPPETPERPSGTITSPGTVALDWNDVAAATSYDVRFWLVSVNRVPFACRVRPMVPEEPHPLQANGTADGPAMLIPRQVALIC